MFPFLLLLFYDLFIGIFVKRTKISSVIPRRLRGFIWVCTLTGKFYLTRRRDILSGHKSSSTMN